MPCRWRSSSVDYVYCCEVLHHNDLAGLRRTFSEIFRVLRPGGRLLMVNETLKTLRDPHGVHVEGVEQYEGYEHAHWAFATAGRRRARASSPRSRSRTTAVLRRRRAARRRRAPCVAAARGGFVLRRPRRAPGLSGVAEQRCGRRVDEHDRHQAHALRGAPRGRSGRRRAPRACSPPRCSCRAIGAAACAPPRPPAHARGARRVARRPNRAAPSPLRGSRRRTARSG